MLCLNKIFKPKDCWRNSSSSARNHHSSGNSKITSYHSWVVPEFLRMGLEGSKVSDPWDTQAQNQYLKTLSRERAYSQEALKRMLQKLEQITFHCKWETLGADEQQGEKEDLLGKALQTTSKTQAVANSPASVCPSFFPFVFLSQEIICPGEMSLSSYSGISQAVISCDVFIFLPTGKEFCDATEKALGFIVSACHGGTFLFLVVTLS